MNVDIIAELGSNPVDYEWDTDIFCERAARTGATHVKIQLYKAEHFPAPYQAEKRRLEFPRNRICEFAENAHRFGLKAGASVFDAEAVALAAIDLDFLKLAAREQDNHELSHSVEYVCSMDKPFYRSISRWESLYNYWYIPYGKTLWAIQKYPASMAESLITLLIASARFSFRGLRWGWSSHTVSGRECILAKHLGASVIERHFVLSDSDIESGHSSLPKQFERLCRELKRNETICIKKVRP
jgi:sialic acid synthase SpsE